MRKGFTLVELSIVLVIVGLLIGGILVGQSLIDSARVNRLASDLGQYEIAVIQFNDRFKQLPGDSEYFSPPGAPDGILDVGDTDGDGVRDPRACNGVLGNIEAFQAWTHLSQARMLSKDYPAYSPTQCGGTNNNNYDDPSHAGVLWPHTDLSSQAQGFISNTAFFSNFASKTPRISVTQTRQGGFTTVGSFALDIFLNPLDTLALESKLGGQSFKSGVSQIGLINFSSSGERGNCHGPNNGGRLCGDSEAGWGNLRYSILN